MTKIISRSKQVASVFNALLSTEDSAMMIYLDNYVEAIEHVELLRERGLNATQALVEEDEALQEMVGAYNEWVAVHCEGPWDEEPEG